jgi:hypothetical protein
MPAFFFLPIYQSVPFFFVKSPWSLGLNLCLKFTDRLRDLTDNCMCGLQRWACHSKIMLNTIIVHRVSPCNLLCDLLSKPLLLNLFWFAIRMGLNTYWLKTLQLFILYSKEFQEHNFTLTLWGIVCTKSKCNPFSILVWIENVKRCEYFLKALYVVTWLEYIAV